MARRGSTASPTAAPSYELRYDARAADAAIAAAPPDQAADVFVRMVSNADLDADQMETLRNRVSDISGVGKRTLDAKLKAAQAETGLAARKG